MPVVSDLNNVNFSLRSVSTLFLHGIRIFLRTKKRKKSLKLDEDKNENRTIRIAIEPCNLRNF